MSGHNLFWLFGLKAENALTLYSPFCHEDAARYTNLYKMTNNVETMNIKARETASGYVAHGANSDTEFHIKYAPYTFFLTETARQTGITIHLSLYANKIRSARALRRKTVCRKTERRQHTVDTAPVCSVRVRKLCQGFRGKITVWGRPCSKPR